MPNGVFNGNYPKPTWDRPVSILGADGRPLSPTGDGNGTATDRFARRYGIDRGPESGFALPQVLTFTSILGASYRNYYHGQYDEAMRFSREDALAMRNDAYIISLLNERKNAVATRKWHLEVDNPKDAWQASTRDGLTQLVRAIPRWTNLTLSGLEAIWFGRAGDQFVPKFQPVKLPALPRSSTTPGLPAISVAPSQGEYEARNAWCITNHLPIEGDKIDFDFSGNPYVLVTPMAAWRLQEQNDRLGYRANDLRRWDEKEKTWNPAGWPEIKAKHADFGYTTIGGIALYLKGTWRERFRIHKHDCLDASFFQPWKASAIHGVGIRSVIFWYWWLRQEFLGNVTDWCARTGLGMKLWYFEAGNPVSERHVDQAARDQTDRVNIKVPYLPGDPRPTVEVIETSGTGADLLLRIVKHVEDYLERYIVGQSMSGGGEDFSGFGDRGRSKMASDTQYQITKLDAARFADTNTTDVIDLMKKYTYPEADFSVRMVYDVDDPEVAKWVEGAKNFVDMGGKIVADEARARLGLSAPRPGDETVGGMEQLQAQQATSGHVKPPEGLAPDSEPSAPSQDQPSPSDASFRMAEEACRLRYSGEAQKHVTEQLLGDFPAEALGDWMDDVEWTGPVAVPLDEIDFSNVDTWRASKEPKRVKKFAKKIKKGKMKPVVLIKTPRNEKKIVCDGHHRTLGYRRLGRPVMAFVGTTGRSKGPWDNLHNSQKGGSSKTDKKDQYAGHVLPTAGGHIIDPQGGQKATGFVGVGGESHGGEHKPGHKPEHPQGQGSTTPAPTAPATPGGELSQTTPDALAQSLDPREMQRRLDLSVAAFPTIQSTAGRLAAKYQKLLREQRRDIGEDDLASEAWVAVQKALPKWDGKGNFDAWAAKVATNRIHDILKVQKGRVGGFAGDFDQGNIPERSQDAPADRGSDQLDEMSKRLPEAQRKVIEGIRAGKSEMQLAEEFGTDRSTINRLKHRATTSMREMAQPAETYAAGLELLRYLCPDVPERYEVDGRSGDYRRHHGKSVEYAVERLHSLAERADDASDDEIEGTVAGIAKQFTAPELREVAKAFGVKGLSSKGLMIDRIIQKIIAERDKPEPSEPEKNSLVDAVERMAAEYAKTNEEVAAEARKAVEAEAAEVFRHAREEAAARLRQAEEEAKAKIAAIEADKARAIAEAETERDRQLAGLVQQVGAIPEMVQKYAQTKDEDDMKAADFAKALGQAFSKMPAPQVNIDTKELAQAIVDGLAKAKPKEVTITRGKDGEFKARTD